MNRRSWASVGSVVMALGCCFPLPLTALVLGIIAIAQIRASRGRLYGMTLAVIDVVGPIVELLGVFALAIIWPALSSAALTPVTIGSGRLVTRDLRMADFQSVEISGAIDADISRSDTFSTSITADDNLIDYVTVDKTGSKFSLGFNGPVCLENATIKAEIAMPTLENLNIQGASHAIVSGFKLSQPVSMELSGASTLDGSLNADRMKLRAQGASRTNLRGSVNVAELQAQGACEFNLGALAIDTADVELEGASRATINAQRRLDYALRGASHLRYQGNPNIGRCNVTGASSVTKDP
jgi:hypothetical protein